MFFQHNAWRIFNFFVLPLTTCVQMYCCRLPSFQNSHFINFNKSLFLLKCFKFPSNSYAINVNSNLLLFVAYSINSAALKFLKKLTHPGTCCLNNYKLYPFEEAYSEYEEANFLVISLRSYLTL